MLDTTLIPNYRTVLDIIHKLKNHGITTLIVGGCVRDLLMGKSCVDIDLEVYGVDADKLVSILSEFFEIDVTGKAFGVIKVKYHNIDISLPRRESKVGKGHKGFKTEPDSKLSIEGACLRRDFTINAMAYEPTTELFYDYFGGQNDLKNGVLRHTSDKFSEDPLRVLRGMQFIARFNLQPHPQTIKLCQSISMEGLPKERLFGEFRKLIFRGNSISKGLDFLDKTGWIKYFPELDNLKGCPQNPKWHPEGDVWEHTKLAMDGFTEVSRTSTLSEKDNLIIGLAVLCHDMGKPTTTVFKDNWTSPKHESDSVVKAKKFLNRLTDDTEITDKVLTLIAAHGRPEDIFQKESISDRTIRRLANDVGNLKHLMLVYRADKYGQQNFTGRDIDNEKRLLARAKELEIEDSKPKPIVMGRHLITGFNLEPGPIFSVILNKCYEAQLDGEFENLKDGLRFVDIVLTNGD